MHTPRTRWECQLRRGAALVSHGLSGYYIHSQHLVGFESVLGSGCGWCCCCGCGCVSGCGSEAGVWLSTRLPPAALTFCFLALARHFATPTRWEGWRGSRVQRVGQVKGVFGMGYWGMGYWVLNSCPASSINFVDWFLLKRAQLDTCPTIP